MNFHSIILGSDVRDHLFRSENLLILECSLEEKSECSLYFHYIFTLQRSDVRDFENSLFFLYCNRHPLCSGPIKCMLKSIFFQMYFFTEDHDFNFVEYLL